MATKTSNYALRLQASLKKEAERAAKEEGTTLNQLINVAVAEKLAALRTEDYFKRRAAKANIPATLEALKSVGGDDLIAGDER